MKTLLNKITSGVFTFSLLVLISSGCEDTYFNNDNRTTVDNPANANNLINPGLNFGDYLLNATFESDPIPGAPNKALPGLPIGDQLKYETDNTTFVLYSGSGDQKSIYIPEREVDSGVNSDTRMQFVSRPGSNNGILTVTWAGQLVGHKHYDNNETDEIKQDGSKAIWITDGSGNKIALFQIECLSIRSVDLLHGFPCPSCTQYNWTYYHLFPNPPTMAQHQFTLTFNLNTKLFSIKFVNHDGAVVTANNIPFPYTPTLAKFTLNISPSEGGYIVDYVTMRQTPYISPPI
jgi:hypothetical protein